MNRTCFNGLYRTNKSGKFNVPFNKSEKVNFDYDNIESVSNILKNTTILNGDYKSIYDYIDNNTFVYFDPPYRPINKTSNFTSYTSEGFDDKLQIELSDFCKKISSKCKIMLSNSYTDDGFYEKYFDGFNINLVDARRSINSDASKRGKIKEVVITNY